MLLLGIDVGTSSVKVSVVDAATQQCIATAQYPETEASILSLQPGWAEQSAEDWWNFTQQAILKAHATSLYNPDAIGAIGIAYQMHGLVCINKQQKVLRNSIIWCDSRAVPYGQKAFDAIGHSKALQHLLNSPGNFTAAKLAWVKEQEPEVYNNIDKILLPGDFIAMQLTGQTTTSPSALSEGIFWDFKNDTLSNDVMQHFDFNASIIPTIQPAFSCHGSLKQPIAEALLLKAGIPVSYKAGDQPNNALSLNVLQPGEVAATAGTSGVIYAVSDSADYDALSRVNSFAHVNHSNTNKRIGVLLCINGTGILNKWLKNNFGGNSSYAQLNEAAAGITPGADGMSILPFGNGAERIFNNKLIGTQITGVDLNRHSAAHMYRAGQEGIACAFRYGLDIMRSNGITPAVIRAGNANMFLSSVFTEAFVNTTNTPVELYNNDGSVGAALGAGIGLGYYKNSAEAFSQFKPLARIEPTKAAVYNNVYAQWQQQLNKFL